MVKNITKRQRRLESDYKHVVENPVITETLQVSKKTKQAKTEEVVKNNIEEKVEEKVDDKKETDSQGTTSDKKEENKAG